MWGTSVVGGNDCQPSGSPSASPCVLPLSDSSDDDVWYSSAEYQLTTPLGKLGDERLPSGDGIQVIRREHRILFVVESADGKSASATLELREPEPHRLQVRSWSRDSTDDGVDELAKLATAVTSLPGVGPRIERK
jgi:hypothetical protein